jgi:hypothetical protein
MDWELRPRQAPGLEITEVVGGFVVQKRDGDRLHFLNPTAAFILQICDGGIRADEMPELLASAFALERIPRDDVETCLTALLREGLLLDA